MEPLIFTDDEKQRLGQSSRRLASLLRNSLGEGDFKKLRRNLEQAAAGGFCHRDRFGFNPINRSIVTACTLCEQISPDRNMVIATLLFNPCRHGYMDHDSLTAEWGDDVAHLVDGLIKVSSK